MDSSEWRGRSRFYIWFRDNPRDKKGVNQAELDLLKHNIPSGGHGNAPWGKFARSKTVWLLCGQYFALSFPWYFLITWAPTFIDERFHVDVNSSMWLKTLPLLMCGLGSFFSGVISAPLTRLTGNIVITRRILGCTGFMGAAIFLVVGDFPPSTADRRTGGRTLGFLQRSGDADRVGLRDGCGGGYSGTLSGTMNMMGNLGGAVYGPAVGFVLSHTNHNWNAVLFMGAIVYLAGFFMWMVIDPVTPIDRDAVLNTQLSAFAAPRNVAKHVQKIGAEIWVPEIPEFPVTVHQRHLSHNLGLPGFSRRVPG